MERDASYWVAALELEPHPEGGFFVETYRAQASVEVAGCDGTRAYSTAIYFLMMGGAASRLHRIRSDELWHFHTGSAMTLYVLRESGTLVETRLGGDPESGESFQAMVPAGAWFGATVEDPRGFALVSCTVAPGFDFRDLEMAERGAMLSRYPEHAEVIERLTRG